MSHVFVVVLAVLVAVALVTLAVRWIPRVSSGAKQKFTVANTVLANILAAFSLVVAIGTMGQSGQSNLGGGASVGRDGTSIEGGDGSTNFQGDNNSFTYNYDTDKTPEDNLNANLQKLASLPGAHQPPKGNGPWQYVTLGSGPGVPVFVRDGYRLSDKHLPGDPGVMEAITFYADCQIESDFAPEPFPPNTDVSPKSWLKIRWPTPSNPPADVWITHAYAFPVGHNGAIPRCPSGS